ncbi:MAG: hypothetical protein AABW71_00320 [Nanoarchaeota archaeon]
MVEQRIIAQLRAVPKDDGFYGVVRMRGARGANKIEGICADFSVADQVITYSQNEGDLFFYGNKTAFLKNFRSSEIASAMADDLFPSHLDREYDHNNRYQYDRDGFARISVEECKLDKGKIILARDILIHLSSRIKFEDLKKITLPPKETSGYRAIRAGFDRMFVKELFDLAEKAGHYLDLSYYVGKSKIEIASFLNNPPTLVFSSGRGINC